MSKLVNNLIILPNELKINIISYISFTPLTKKELKDAVVLWCKNEKSKIEAIKKYGHISLWNTENITDMSYLFSNLQFNEDISKWNVSNVTNMNRMFRSTKSFNQPLNDWDVSNVTNMAHMFYMEVGKYKVPSVFNQPLDNWDVSNVVNMSYMFFGAKKFNQSLNNWDVSNVINMEMMFTLNGMFACSMEQLPIWYTN